MKPVRKGPLSHARTMKYEDSGTAPRGRRRRRNARSTLLPAVALSLFASSAAGQPEKLRAVVGEETRAQSEASASQERIDRLDDDTQKLLSEYRQVTAETESFKTYNDQLAAQIPSQVEEME